jgi:hypothetical protein
MIIEMPLPRPRSVICSPSHIRNMVPATSVNVAGSTKLARPGAITTPWFWKAMAARELRELAATGLAFLAQRLPLRHDHRHHLHDDRRGDVRHDAEREDRKPLQRAAREHVEHAQDRALLVREETGERTRIDARHRDERADAIDDQAADQEEEPLPELDQPRRLAEGGCRAL